MQSANCSILTIAPYKIIPPLSGGQLAIVHLHHYLGKLCADNIVSTANNEKQHRFSFNIHSIFPVKTERYLPLYEYGKIKSIAKAYDVTHIICEHPYMAPTAIMLARRLKLPWFLRSHNIESQRFKALGKPWWKMLYYYERFAMRMADGVFFITQEDAAWSQFHYRLKTDKCHFIPFGTEMLQRPMADTSIKTKLAADLGIDAAKPWLYFLGALDYQPNEQAVSYILNEVMPLLNARGMQYEVLIGGKGLVSHLQKQIAATDNIIYTGFVPDLDAFINACDVMLNPVLAGGGVKTKAVEALAYNKNVVSSHSGAAGLITEVCGNKLWITPDGNWPDFTAAVAEAIHTKNNIPSTFYETYHWDSVAAKVLHIING
jgi:hypothetical protein